MFKRGKKKKRKKFHISKKELERLYYDLGLTQAQIADHCGCGERTIYRRMKEYGLEARNAGDYCRIDLPCEELRELYLAQELSTVAIAARYNCSDVTVSQCLRKCSIPLRHRGTPSQEYVPAAVLATWPSPPLAYIVGLIASDGCLLKGNYVVSLASTDRELIEHYYACLQLDSRAKTHKRLLPSGKTLYKVKFSDRPYRAFLEKLGLTPAKSWTLRPLDIPASIFPDFARGYWEGDGGFYARRRWRAPKYLRARLASSSPVFLTWMQRTIGQQTGLRGSISDRQLYYHGPEAVALGRWMYYAPRLPSLTRKRVVWEQFT